MNRALARWSALVIAFAICAAGAAFAMLEASRTADVGNPRTPLDDIVNLDGQLRSLAMRDGQRPAIVFLGDSLVMDPIPPDTSVPKRLRLLLDRGPPRFRVEPVVAAGQRLASHHFLSERIVEARPDRVVLSLNLATFSDGWQLVQRFELAGFLPLRRWHEVIGLPLESLGGSLDRLALYRAIVGAGGLEAWSALRRHQVRLAAAYWSVETRLVGEPSAERSYRNAHNRHRMEQRSFEGRATPEFARMRYRSVMAGLDAGNAELQSLDRLLARLAAEGIPTLVYAAPMNVDHLKRLDLYDPSGIDRTISVLEETAARRGARFLDLHSLLRDGDFSDAQDHLRTDGPDLPSTRIARRLRQALLPRGVGVPANG